MKNFEINKVYRITYKGYNERPADELGLIIDIKNEEIKYKTTECNDYNWIKKIKKSEIIEFSEINIIDFSEELVSRGEEQVKMYDRNLREAKERLRKIEKFIENRSFLGKFKNLLGCSIEKKDGIW